MQASEPIRTAGWALLGDHSAAFLQNHGATMFFVPTLVMLLGAAELKIGRPSSGSWLASFGIFLGLIYTLAEILAMQPSYVPDQCGEAMGMCRGDLGDLLSVSVPVVAGIIYLLRHRAAHTAI